MPQKQKLKPEVLRLQAGLFVDLGWPARHRELVPANLDEREAAEAVLFALSHGRVFADKGFIGVDWQADITAATGIRIFTSKRRNQHDQNTPAFDLGFHPRWLNGLRGWIEGHSTNSRTSAAISNIC